MPPLSHLLMLIVAFFGADLSGAWVDIDNGYGDTDPDIIADYCFGYDPEAADLFHNDYSELWWSWENCVLGYEDYTVARAHDAHLLTDDEAEDLVAEVWAAYTPWMRESLAEGLYFPFGDQSERYRIVLAGDWAPRLPFIDIGSHKVDEHCGDSEYVVGCAVLPTLAYEKGERLGDTVTWQSGGVEVRYGTYLGEVTHSRNGRIVTPDRNRYLVLHELAHLIDSYQHALWPGGEHQRTEGHDLDFKCLLLDLYNDYGDEFVTEISNWWEVSYNELHRLCQTIAPGYARPTATDVADEPAEPDAFFW